VLAMFALLVVAQAVFYLYCLPRMDLRRQQLFGLAPAPDLIAVPL